VSDPSRDNQLPLCERTQSARRLYGESLQRSFGVDVGVQKRPAEWIERDDRLGWCYLHLIAPAADGDLAGLCVDAGDEMLRPDQRGDGGWRVLLGGGGGRH